MRTTVALLLLIGMLTAAVHGCTFYDCGSFSDCTSSNWNCNTRYNMEINDDCIKIEDGFYIKFTSHNFGVYWYHRFPNAMCNSFDRQSTGSFNDGQCALYNGTTAKVHYFKATGCDDGSAAVATAFAATFIGILLLFILLPIGVCVTIIIVIIIIARQRRTTTIYAPMAYPVAPQPGYVQAPYVTAQQYQQQPPPQGNPFY